MSGQKAQTRLRKLARCCPFPATHLKENSNKDKDPEEFTIKLAWPQRKKLFRTKVGLRRRTKGESLRVQMKTSTNDSNCPSEQFVIVRGRFWGRGAIFIDKRKKVGAS